MLLLMHLVECGETQSFSTLDRSSPIRKKKKRPVEKCLLGPRAFFFKQYNMKLF